MVSLRMMLIRGSVLVNMMMILYLCTMWISSQESIKGSQMQQHYRSLEGFVEQVSVKSPLDSSEPKQNDVRFNLDSISLDPKKNEVGVGFEAEGANKQSSDLEKDANNVNAGLLKDDVLIKEDIGDPEKNDMLLDGKIKGSREESAVEKASIAMAEKEIQLKMNPYYDPQFNEPPREVQESLGVTENFESHALSTDEPDPPSDSLEKKMYPDFRGCITKPSVPFHSQRGEFWILENYIPAALSFRCDETITYTTHGDYTFLDNLETLTSRWQGPVSISVYAPGTDFEATISTILYLRDCWAEGIKKFVTFHLIYHTDHVPKKIPTTEELLTRKMDCSVDPPKWANVTTYRQQKKLLYPVNVARNVARRQASTYFVFPSDVELYPSINFIPEFFKMLKKPDVSNTTQPRVYVFSIFEVEESVSPPETKPELIKMLASNKAIPFHQRVCKSCHRIPHSKEWASQNVTQGLSVLHVGKREGLFKKWEPIYVGTQREPLYDERLSWEGKSDKMTQMYILCVRGYEFHILDNAFLVHRPGIKKMKRDPRRDAVVGKQSRIISRHILPEYKTLFGYKKECVV